MRLFPIYRVLAMIVGVLLTVLLVGWGMELFAPDDSAAHEAGAAITQYVGITHGWLYIAYLVTAFALSRREGWAFGFTLLVLLAGTVPFLIFWVERQVAKRVRPASSASTEPSSPPAR